MLMMLAAGLRLVRRAMLAGGLRLVRRAPADAHDWVRRAPAAHDARCRRALGETGPG